MHAAVARTIGVAAVVFIDNASGNAAPRESITARYISSDQRNPDFAALARSCYRRHVISLAVRQSSNSVTIITLPGNGCGRIFSMILLDKHLQPSLNGLVPTIFLIMEFSFRATGINFGSWSKLA